MADIDYSPDSAPLSGATTPSIDDINALAQTYDRTVWRPAPPEPAQAKLSDWGFPAAVFAGILAYIAFSLLPLALAKMHTLTSRPENIAGMPDLESATTVYAILKNPKPSDFAELNAAAATGTKVTLICPTNAPQPSASPSFGIFPVSPSMIPAEGYILNGFQIYPKKMAPTP